MMGTVFCQCVRLVVCDLHSLYEGYQGSAISCSLLWFKQSTAAVGSAVSSNVDSFVSGHVDSPVVL